MTLMEERTLADHDVNVRSTRQELRLLEEQLHGRNEPQSSSTVTDEDTVSRKAAIKAIRDTYRVSYPIDMISKDDAADVLTELPSVTPTVTADPDTVSRQAVYDTLTEYYHHKTDMQHKALAEALSRVPPSPSRPQEHGKSCEGCEWEDAEGEGCTNCARFYVDFYYEKRNGGCGMSDWISWNEGSPKRNVAVLVKTTSGEETEGVMLPNGMWMIMIGKREEIVCDSDIEAWKYKPCKWSRADIT